MHRLAQVALLAAVCSAGIAGGQQRSVAGSATAVQPRAVQPRGPLSADERNTIAVFESVSPSVVYITTVQYVRDYFSRNVMRSPRSCIRCNNSAASIETAAAGIFGCR